MSDAVSTSPRKLSVRKVLVGLVIATAAWLLWPAPGLEGGSVFTRAEDGRLRATEGDDPRQETLAFSAYKSDEDLQSVTSSSVTNPDGAFWSARVVLWPTSDSALLRQTIAALLEAFDARPDIQSVTVMAPGEPLSRGELAPDLVLRLAMQEDVLHVPGFTKVEGKLAVDTVATRREPVPAYRAVYDFSGDYTLESTVLGLTSPQQRYKPAGRALGNGVAKGLLAFLDAHQPRVTRIADLPPAFFPAFRPAPEPAALTALGARVITSDRDLLLHNRTHWSFPETDGDGDLDALISNLQSDGWQAQASTKLPRVLSKGAGVLLLDRFPAPGRSGAGGGPPYERVAVYSEPVTAAAKALAFDELAATGGAFEALALFRDEMTEEQRSALVASAQAARPDRPQGWLQKTRVLREAGLEDDARTSLDCMRTSAWADGLEGAFKNVVEAEAKALGVELGEAAAAPTCPDAIEVTRP